jgi:hypothetical protein
MERSLWLVAALFAVLAIVGWRSGGGLTTEGNRSARGTTSGADAPSASTPATELASLASAVVARDPFRLERRPSSVAFGTQAMVPAAPAEPSRRPRLLLSGVFGPPWQAVLEGVPGREGSVVARVGDVFGDLRVRSIRGDTVVVQGADTTWKLTVRHVW